MRNIKLTGQPSFTDNKTGGLAGVCFWELLQRLLDNPFINARLQAFTN
jgi:hypothetical protein